MSSRRLTVLIAVTSLLLLVPLLLLPRLAHGQAPSGGQLADALRVPDSLHTQVLELRDGSTLVGRIREVGADSVTFATSIAVLSVPRSAIVKVREIRRPMRSPNGELWLPDPNVTRLLFAPTGRMLERGDGYFSNAYLLLLGVFAAPSDRVTIGGGMSIIPSGDFMRNNAFYVMPKVGLVQSPKVNVALGGLIGMIPAADDANGGVGYAVATLGPPESNLTLGGGYLFADGEVEDSPVLMVGFYHRLARRTAFISENYTTSESDGLVYSYGLRFFGEKLSVDFAFWNATGSDFYPGVPYVAFAKHF